MSSGAPVEQPNTSPRATRLIEEIGNALDNQQRERRQQQNNLNQQDLNPRDRLFHALFIKIGLVYSRIVPKRCRVILELIVLMQVKLRFLLNFPGMFAQKHLFIHNFINSFNAKVAIISKPVN